MKKYLLLVLLLSQIQLSAQDNIGFIIDENGNSLDFANIAFYKDGRHITVCSQENGSFDLPKVDWDTLHTLYIGYETAILSKVDFQDNSWITLKEHTYELETIVISEKKKRKRRCGCPCMNYQFDAIGTIDVTLTKEVPYKWTTYPNPATDFINIKANLNFQGVMEIIDLNNRIIGTYQINEIPMRIDISQLPSGSYHIRNRYQEEIYYVGQFIKVGL